MILYRDGDIVDMAIVPDSLIDVVDANVLVGAKNYGFRWEGYIDEPRLYGRALSQDQIQALHEEGNDIIEPQETRGGEQWYCQVTPFSTSAVGSPVTSNTITLQGPEITGLSISSTSGNNLISDDLTASYSSNARVRETASAWFVNDVPVNTLYLPLEADYPQALLDFSGSDNHVSRSVDQDEIPSWYPYVRSGSGAMEFTGNDYLLAEDALPLSASYTKTAYIYLYSSGFRNIMSSATFADNNHNFKVNPDMTLSAGHSFGDIIVSSSASSVSLSTGQWYFVAVSFDYESEEMALFVNGTEVDRATVPADLLDVADPDVLVGALGFGFGFVGLLDEPRVFNYALSPEQISTLEANGNDIIRSEETEGSDVWHVEVTPFSAYEVGTTVESSSLTIVGQIVTQIPDQGILEGESFTPISLDDYVEDFSYPDEDQDWTSSGSSDLIVTIDPDTRVATVETPNDDWYGSETITFTVTNPNMESNDIEVIFSVENINDAPELTEVGDLDIDEDETLLDILVEFTDADPTDAHTITVVSDEANVIVDNLTGDVSGSTYDLLPAAGWSGTAQITVTVTDDGAGALNDSETYTLTVGSVNDAPVLTEIGPQIVSEDEILTGLLVNYTDDDPLDLHTITVVSDEANVTVDGLSGHSSGSTYNLVPATDWSGTAQITVTVTDNGEGPESDSEVYTLTVNAVNDEPELTEVGDRDTDEDVTLNLSVDFTDADPTDTHTITVVSDEANVSVENLSGDISGSTYDLVPAADWSGTAQITVTVTDNGTGALNDAETYTLTVNPVNDAPVLTDIGPQIVDEDNTLVGLEVVFTDVEPSDLHTITVVSDESNITVANLSGQVSGSTYDLVPAADWTGTAQITVTVTDDGTGNASDSETYTLTVNNINDDPTGIVLSENTVDERVALGTVIGLFTSTDVDPNDDHQYAFALDGGVNDVDNDAFIIVGDTLKSNAEFDFEMKDSYSIYVETDDGNGGVFAQGLTISINDVDETSVRDMYNNPAFNVYPNPAVDFVTVEIDNPDNKELLLEIYSSTGRLLIEEPIYYNKNRIDLTGFTNGMYFLKIKGEDIYGTRKIIVKD
jgi:hypothetical protein